MASNSSPDKSARQTRLQESTEKRQSEEMIKEKEELKRQKKMFAQNKLIGPRDILVNSHIHTIKLEEGAGCRSSMKLEPLECQPSLVDESQDCFVNPSLPKIKLDVESGVVVKMEETLELNEPMSTEQFDKSLEPVQNNVSFVNARNAEQIVSESENDKFVHNYVRLLNIHIYQKDQEINLLMEMLRELRSRSSDNQSSNMESDNEHMNLDDSIPTISSAILSSGSSKSLVVSLLTSDLKEKDAKSKILSLKILKVQEAVFGKCDSSLQTSKTSESQLSSLLPSSIPQTKTNPAAASFNVQENSSSTNMPGSDDQIPKQVGQLKHHQPLDFTVFKMLGKH